MATTRKQELRVLDESEVTLVEQTRHPALRQLGETELNDLLRRLRERRDRAQSIANRQRRAVRGKAGAPPATFEKADAGNRQKADLLGEALARANKERSRRRAEGAREALQANARRALKLKAKSPPARRPSPGRAADEGPSIKANERSDRLGSAMEAGRVSQFVKDAQAKRDSR